MSSFGKLGLDTDWSDTETPAHDPPETRKEREGESAKHVLHSERDNVAQAI